MDNEEMNQQNFKTDGRGKPNKKDFSNLKKKSESLEDAKRKSKSPT